MWVRAGLPEETWNRVSTEKKALSNLTEWVRGSLKRIRVNSKSSAEQSNSRSEPLNDAAPGEAENRSSQNEITQLQEEVANLKQRVTMLESYVAQIGGVEHFEDVHPASVEDDVVPDEHYVDVEDVSPRCLKELTHEEYTFNSFHVSSPPCAALNITLDIAVAARGDLVVPVRIFSKPGRDDTWELETSVSLDFYGVGSKTEYLHDVSKPRRTHAFWMILSQVPYQVRFFKQSGAQ